MARHYRRFLLSFVALAALAGRPASSAAEEVLRDPAGDMVLVPGGTFIFGSDDGEPDEAPRQQRGLPPFWIDATEVTVEAYARFAEATGRRPPPDWPEGRMPAGRERRPVVNVTWEDATAFATWAGKRLPTELEWERAARGTDGRRFPWGDAEDESRHNVREDGKVGPVDSLPTGRSLEGAFHLFGNAWEWCADWYGPYPGSLEESVHFGSKYRVLRGGGAVYFYGIPLPRAVTARARMLPFGRHDALGFRCAKDAPPPDARGVRPAGQRRGTMDLRVREDGGAPRRGEVVTVGVPFAQGAVASTEELRLLDGAGAEVALQARGTGTWRDGSLKWALLDFPATLDAGAETTFHLEHGEGVRRGAAETPLVLEETASSIVVDTGPARFRVPRDRPGLIEDLALGTAASLDGGLELAAWTGKDAREKTVQAAAPDSVTVEEHGPLRVVLKIEGPFADRNAGQGSKEALRYLVRVVARARSREVELHVTFLNAGAETAWLRKLWISGRWAGAPSAWRLGGDRGPLEGKMPPAASAGGPAIAVSQETEARYTISRAGEPAASGTRAPGWFEVEGTRAGGMSGVIAHFWQNFPKGIELAPDGFVVDLWPEGPAGPFDADPGLAKTHRLFLSPRGPGEVAVAEELAARVRRPLLAVPPPSRICASRALGLAKPYDFDSFPLYEALTEESADLHLRERPHGMRHFGDFYYGGPYKGKNAYGDLEYDMPLNYAIQYARTGLRKYLDAAIDQARHQADIDVNHRTGMQYKHGPRHTETEADLGHVFLRGLVEVYHLTGEQRLLDVAREIGDWLGPKVARPRSQGNERQIGWSLYALTGIYEATWDERYLRWARTNMDELLAGLGPTGKFDIRWDNRIAFFQGIAASGFLRYHEATGDDRVGRATLLLCERMLGFYPEYLGRTLEGLAWAYDTSGDERFLQLLARTYETSLLRAVSDGLELGAGTIFTVHCLPFIARTGIERPLARPVGLGPEALSSDRSLHRHHIGCPPAEMLLEVPDASPFDLFVLRNGCAADASVTVSRKDGSTAARALFQAGPDITQRRVIPLEPGVDPADRVLRVRLETLAHLATREGPPNSTLSATSTSWDIVSSRPLRAVFHSPDGAGLETLTPRLYFRARSGARRLSLSMKGSGEGYHGAVLYDPHGNVAAVSAAFIDLEDPTTHEYRLEAPVGASAPEGLWSLDVQDVTFTIEGAEPFFATSPESFFVP